MKFSSIVYLNKDIILEIHDLQLKEHGGASGIRDHAGLESAIAQPQAVLMMKTCILRSLIKPRHMLFFWLNPKHLSMETKEWL